MPVTTPRVVTTFDTEAIATFPVDQVTSAVTSFVELSLYVAVAFICSVRPLTTLGFAGVRVIETSVAFETVSVVDEVTPLFVSRAPIVVVPAATAEASPGEFPVLEIVATPVLDEDQVTTVVMSAVEPSLYVPMAL